jgi:hypothetical protein
LLKRGLHEKTLDGILARKRDAAGLP